MIFEIVFPISHDASGDFELTLEPGQTSTVIWDCLGVDENDPLEVRDSMLSDISFQGSSFYKNLKSEMPATAEKKPGNDQNGGGGGDILEK